MPSGSTGGWFVLTWVVLSLAGLPGPVAAQSAAPEVAAPAQGAPASGAVAGAAGPSASAAAASSAGDMPAPTDERTGADGAVGGARAPIRHHRPPSAAQVLDEHVRALTKELALNAKQQAGVRQILIKERVAILELRKRGTGAQDMVAASHKILEHTRGDIRALLDEDQRKKFFVDVPEDNLAPAQADLDYWLRSTRSKPAESAATPAAGTAPSR